MQTLVGSGDWIPKDPKSNMNFRANETFMLHFHVFLSFAGSNLMEKSLSSSTSLAGTFDWFLECWNKKRWWNPREFYGDGKFMSYCSGISRGVLLWMVILSTRRTYQWRWNARGNQTKWLLQSTFFVDYLVMFYSSLSIAVGIGLVSWQFVIGAAEERWNLMVIVSIS